MRQALCPEYVVYPLFDQLKNSFSLERAVRWSNRTVYAARNPHHCDQPRCACAWTVWPEGLPDEWMIVGANALRFGADVRGPTLAQDDPRVQAEIDAAGSHTFARTQYVRATFERGGEEGGYRFEWEWSEGSCRAGALRRDPPAETLRCFPLRGAPALDALPDETDLPVEVREKLRLLRAATEST